MVPLLNNREGLTDAWNKTSAFVIFLAGLFVITTFDANQRLFVRLCDFLIDFILSANFGT